MTVETPENNWRDEIGPLLRTQQFIVASMTAGSLLFLAVTVTISGFEFQPLSDSIITYAAIIFAAVGIFARLIIPGIFFRLARKRIIDGGCAISIPQGFGLDGAARKLESLGDAGQLLFLSQTKTIISAAIIEGAAFFSLIAYFIENTLIAVSLAIALIVVLVLHFPTRSGLMHWVEDQLAIIKQERDFGA